VESTREPAARAPRIAIVHEWLVDFAGSERVLQQICALYPDADLFTLVDHMQPEARARIKAARSFTSFLQRMPGTKRLLHWYLPLMPLAIQQFDLTSYDLVLSSSHCVAKGVITGPNTLHLCYCHSPMRYAWDMQGEYLRVEGLDRGLRSGLTRILLMFLRIWDATSANGVDAFAANSHFVGERIRKCYRRNSVVIHPPVDVKADSPPATDGSRADYVTVGRLIAYKNVDIIIEAFRHIPERRLRVIGDGPLLKRLQRGAPGNVLFEGAVDEARKHEVLSTARGFVFAALEDFGIAPVEALAHGAPVIAFAGGGVHDYVTHGANGWLVRERNAEALAAGIRASEKGLPKGSAFACWESVQAMAQARFRKEFEMWVDAGLASPQRDT
jgi:glycosyltransferase involved in cell wall biosynthesis